MLRQSMLVANRVILRANLILNRHGSECWLGFVLNLESLFNSNVVFVFFELEYLFSVYIYISDYGFISSLELALVGPVCLSDDARARFGKNACSRCL
uniref:Uncharacterized protein n=1 Tax=Rhizophora mucronata TaxID=61149 RepID=A0A2P2NL16_RHIMU